MKMEPLILAYDLGTGGCKASLYNADGFSIKSAFVPYQTFYPESGYHEQNPEDWWDAIVTSTRKVLGEDGVDAKTVVGISISGHSLGVVPIDSKGRLLRERTPIWSDTRAELQAEKYFTTADYTEWYTATGNGFPAKCYPLFKLLWYRDNEPDIFGKMYKCIGTKDYINFKLTGELYTDYSYASGSGAYLLKEWKYSEDFLSAAGLSPELLPEIIPSTGIVGNLTKEASAALGLTTETKVVCGGVDNSCMAAGAGNVADGMCYTSLGSSSWIAVTSLEPIVDTLAKPYVFTHIVPEHFTSAVAIFSAGSTLQWVKNVLCGNLAYEAEEKGVDVWELINSLAESSPVGAKKLLLNPSFAGGSEQEATPFIRGGFSGIDLGHTQADILRSTMEGITMNLKLVLDLLVKMYPVENRMMIVGGGSKSRLWRQIFADVFQMDILKSSVDQDAGSLGAAAAAAVGLGLWDDFLKLRDIQEVEDRRQPTAENTAKYKKLIEVFELQRSLEAKMGIALQELKL